MLLDAHFHLWDPRSQPHDWLRELPPLDRPFTVADFETAAGPAGVSSGVLVQAIESTSETAELLALAAEHPAIAGVVGWLDLQHEAVDEQLAELRELPGGEYLVGIRHLVQGEPDPRWLVRDAVQHGIDAVARAGLVYELLVLPHQLEAAIELVGAHQHARFVLDHGAKPELARAGFQEPWASLIAELAGAANVACKVSGLVTEAGADWSARQVGPVIEHLLECFGPHRLLFGSDWPVCTLVASYHEVFALARDTLAGRLEDEELEAVFHANAVAQYRLSVERS